MVKIHKNIDRINNNVYLCSMTIEIMKRFKKYIKETDVIDIIVDTLMFSGGIAVIVRMLVFFVEIS